jgi:hypothetical protein
MAITENRAGYTFNHSDQVAEYGKSVGDFSIVQSNFDSRCEEDLTDINNIKTNLISVTEGDSGTDAIGRFQGGDGFGDTQAEFNAIVIAAGTGSTPPDGTITNAKLATDVKVGSLAALDTTDKTSVQASINEVNTNVGLKSGITHVITSTNGNTYASYPLRVSESTIEAGNFEQSGQTDNTDFPATFATILSINHSSIRFFQILIHATNSTMYTRTFHSSSGDWTDWIQKADTVDVEEASARMPYCKVSRTSDQVSGTTISWNNEVEDSFGMHDNVSNTDRITIVQDGDYLITSSASIGLTTTAISQYSEARININGSIVSTTLNVGFDNESYQLAINDIIPLTIGDYITISSDTTYGINERVLGDTAFTHLTVKRIR